MRTKYKSVTCVTWLAVFLLARHLVAAPDEELLGKNRGYPSGTRANWFFEEAVRVGSLTHRDELFPHHALERSQEISGLHQPGRNGTGTPRVVEWTGHQLRTMVNCN